MRDMKSPMAEVEETTGRSSLFDRLDEASRAAVAAETEWVFLNSGDTLFRQGDDGDALYVVIRGRLQATVAVPGGGQNEVGAVTRGEVVGEMAVLMGEPRSLTIRAVRDSALVRFSKSAFEKIARSNPDAMLAITRRIITRLQQMNLGVKPPQRIATIAVLALGENTGHDVVASALLQALQPFGRVAAVTSASLEGGIAGQTEDQQAAWLDDQERDHDYLLYVGDPGPSAWTSRAVRQADRILLVANGDAAPDAAAVAASLKAMGLPRDGVRAELVLMQPADLAAPKDTERWLTATGVLSHYHARRGRQADIERLARFLTGRAVGLVLGGGGARGFAHIGVIRALHEAGVPIDAIGGTSMGAVIAAQYALGADEPALRVINKRTWIDANPLKDKTLPVVALLSCKKLEKMVVDMFGETQIADLWLPFYCVSADLTNAEMHVHERGSVGRSVRASMALPGIAIPIRDGNALLIDGGVLNNVPADVMKRRCGKVIAVDVTPEKDMAANAPYPEAASGWSFFLKRKTPVLPSIMAIIMRTVMLSSAHYRGRVSGDIDLLVAPPSGGFGMFEWHRLDEIAQGGYDTARPAIAQWLQPTKG